MKSLGYFLMILVVFGSFAPFATAAFTNPASAGFTGGNYGSITNTYQSSRPTFSGFYSGSLDTYWPILNNLKEDQCDAVSSDFIIGIPPGGCSPMVVRSDLLAEQNVPVFCQLSAIRVNPLIDVSTIKSISFKQKNQSDAIAGISFHPARAAVRSYRTLLGSPIDENIGYVVIVLKRQPDERNLEEEISGMLTATIRYDAQGAFGTGQAEYYLEPIPDNEWTLRAADNSFWAGKGYLRVKNVDEDEATIEVLTGKDDVYRTVTLKEGETSSRIYYPGQYCTAAMSLRLNKIDNSEDMAKITIDNDVFWVRKGSKLLGGKCVVKDLNVFPAGSGNIEISCSGNSRFTLMLGDSGVVLNNGTANISVGIGGSVKGKGGKDYYLGYYGKSGALNGTFVILFDKSLSEDDVSLITGIFDVEEFDDVKNMKASLDRVSKFKGKYEIVGEDLSKYGVKVESVGFDSEVAGHGEDSYIPKYLGLSNDAVSDLVEMFPAEEKETGEYWGEEALYKQIILAGLAKDENMQVDLIKKFLAEYPGSKSVEYMRDLKLGLEKFDHAGSSANVFVNNNNYNIRVDGFASGTGASDSVTLRFAGGAAHADLKRGRTYDVFKNFEEIVDVKKQTTVVPRLVIVDIDGSSAKIDYYYKNEKGKTAHVAKTVGVGEYETFGPTRISVMGVEVREVAYVSLIPEVRNTKTEANFTFNINVEKRAFELSPEKAQKKVDRLNNTIAEWEARLEQLGKLIKGLKAACLVTSTVLTLKSFISGFSGGTSIARGAIMDVYEAKCRAEHPGMDLQECYSLPENKAGIERDINAYGAAILAVNKRVKDCVGDSKSVKSDFLETKVVDSEKYVDSLRSCSGGVSAGWSATVDKKNIRRADLSDASDFQAVMLVEETCKNPGSEACKLATAEMKKVLRDNVDRMEVKVKLEENKDLTNVNVPVASNPNIKSVSQQTVSAKGTSLPVEDEGNYLAQVYDPYKDNNRYYVEVDKSSQIITVFNMTGGIVEGEKTGIKNELSKKYKFIIPSGKEDSCSNVIIKPYVRYYESGNKQGFAAIVPIDKREGWYAHVEHSDYDANGLPRAFEICNVGKDGEMGEGAKSGDLCQLFQTSSAGSVSDFIPCPDKGSSAVKRLYQKAESAIRDANRNGNGVTLDGQFVHKTTPLGPSSSDIECTDFMDVDDCNLMFNVCDPVICPTSRCDLGGKFPVSDVIASGIIGSIVLCLPNFGNPMKGGVAIPVCLSGIHAGLDAYVSILRSHRDCLEENIETGVYTGICDEITAIYTCEFFWGQISPILDILMMRFVEGMYGGAQTRGGAEYLTIQKSFDNLDKSVDYFSSNYMANSFRAFNLKNTEEIGSTVCKAFIGTSVPTSADALDSLLEPESPAQFYAYFSDNVFSDATVPSTSHYKVYYHIYAGNDRGAQYRVYLKSPPTSSYYTSRQMILVDSGYAAKGVAADESKDFTAPTGYQELCVSINGVDECGFKSVTSNFGLNYASQAYVNDQQNDRQITSTEDCVTTSASGWGMVSPNLQAGVEKSLGQDDIATSGIIRVCASVNPEQGVVGGNDVYCNPSTAKENNSRCAYGYSCVAVEEGVSDVGVCRSKGSGNKQVSQGRWVDVGYCDNVNMRCWLDSTSVKENLGQYMAVNNLSLDELVRDSEDLVELNEQYKNVKEKINSLEKAIEGLKGKDINLLVSNDGKLLEEVEGIIVGLDEIVGVGNYDGQGSNVAKAEALSLKASVYRLIVEKLFLKSPDVKATGVRPKVTEGVVDSVVDDKVEVKVEGFVLMGTRILRNNKDTGYYLEENNGNYLIKKLNIDGYPIKYGNIIGEKITIDGLLLEPGDNITYLEDYSFKDDWFTLKDDDSVVEVSVVSKEDDGGGVVEGVLQESSSEYLVVESTLLRDVVDTSKSQCSVSVLQSLNPGIPVIETTLIEESAKIIVPDECVEDESKVEKVVSSSEFPNIEMVRIVYTEGIDDIFEFKWDSAGYALVRVKINFIGFGTWTSDPYDTYRLYSGGDLHGYERGDANELLKSETWPILIKKAKEIGKTRGEYAVFAMTDFNGHEFGEEDSYP